MSQLDQLFKDSTVCSNCFRKRAKTWENNYEFDTSYPGNAKPIRLAVPNEDYHRVQSETSRSPARDPTQGLRTACDCGVYSSSEQMRPLKADTLERRSRRLCERLREAGTSVDEDELQDVASSLKRDPSNDLPANEIFERAIAHGT